MKNILMACVLALSGTTAAATSYVLAALDPLVDGSVVELEIYVGRTLLAGDGGRRLFHSQDGRLSAFIDQARAVVGEQLAAADSELASTYRSSDESGEAGKLRYSLEIVLSGREFPADAGGEIATGFLIEATLEAERWDPEYDSEETFSTQRMGFVSDADLERELLWAIVEIVDEITDPHAGVEPQKKRTLPFLDGRLSLDLIPPGHGDLLAFYRRQLDELPAAAELFAEPRGDEAEPITTFSLIGRYPPKDVLLAGEGRYLVTIHWPRVPAYLPEIVIYRENGSIVRAIQVGDLLTDHDRAALARSFPRLRRSWAEGQHSIDQDRDRLVFSWPTGEFFDQPPADRIARIEIDLESGLPVHPPRDYFPRRESRVKLAFRKSRIGRVAPPDGIVCRDGWSPDLETFARAPGLPLSELVARTTEIKPELRATAVMPRHTEIGEKARIEGRVELSLLIAETGKVVCAGVTKKLPMGLWEEARKAVLTWRFAPLPPDHGLARTEVAFDFDLVWIQPPPY